MKDILFNLAGCLHDMSWSVRVENACLIIDIGMLKHAMETR
jgi:hypothetical protein